MDDITDIDTVLKVTLVKSSPTIWTWTVSSPEGLPYFSDFGMCWSNWGARKEIKRAIKKFQKEFSNV